MKRIGMVWFCGVCWAVAAISSAAASLPAPRPITLEEALAMALQNAPSMVQAEGRQRTSAADVRSAYAAFLPSLSVSAGANRRLPAGSDRTQIENGQVITVPVEPWSSSIGFGASVTLFAGGRRFLDLRQARARATSADVGADAERYALSFAVERSYYDVLAARETAGAAQAQIAQAEQQARVANAKVMARTATSSDSLRAEIQLRNARLALMDARDALTVAEAALSRTIGSPDPVTAQESDSLGSVQVSLSDDALRELAERGPAVRQAEISFEVARTARKGAWLAYLPSVTAGYSRGGSGTSRSFDLNPDGYTYSGSLRLSLSLPLFNQLQREGQVVQADVDVANAEAALRDARLAARESITQLLVVSRSAHERVTTQELTVQTAAEDLRVQQLRYAAGESTLLDVLTSQAQLDQARHDLIRARYDGRVAKAQIDALVGRDL